MRAQAALACHADGRRALDEALRQTSALVAEAGAADLVFLFASHAYAEDFPALVRRAYEATRARVLVGCSGQGVIGTAREVEGEPALALLALSLPGATLRAARFTQETLEVCRQPADWQREAFVEPSEVNAWLVFGDPFRMDVEALVGGLAAAYPGRPLVGGLASGDQRAQRTHVFLDDGVYDEGAVAVALGGAYTVRCVVSQGAEPIGEPWTITGARGHLVETISQRPALEVLVSTLEALPPEVRERAQRNLLVGLAMDERRAEFGRGDFLIRNLIGLNRTSGALAISAHPRIGQTLQFQIRDARAADEDLRVLLARSKEMSGEQRPVAAVLCSCNGRGVGLFGEPDHDARTLAELLGVQAIAGFFCNGEIGPVGGRVFLHGYTASIALIVPAGA
ncbi:MAG: FIST C-terminal domain-containing protein [Chloroflexi bacterium]|nr:FIST C-terminal domain-containing protein [Chloroflexota bacterium]